MAELKLAVIIQKQTKMLRKHQGCVLAEPGGPWRLTCALGQLENLRFSYKSNAGHPRFYSFRALGSLSLEHSLETP